MKKLLGIISAILFFVGLVLYGVVLFVNDNFLLGVAIISAIGFILALFAEKGIYKKIGLFGNGIILIITLLIPFIVTTFFWNEP